MTPLLLAELHPALLISGAIMGLCLIVILGVAPELLAGVLTAAAILVPYYALHERNDMSEFFVNGERVEPDAIEIETRDGRPYVATSPLPEYIVVDRELWAQAAEHTYDPHDEKAERPTEALWLETISHADDDKDNDGYVLHIDASNVGANYRAVTTDPDGNRLCQLGSWAEK